MSEAKMDATSRCLSFLCDSRVQLLSNFSECILNRFRELQRDYPNLFNENGDLPAPTDEELLNRLYPHKHTHCRPTDIARCITVQLDPAGLISFCGAGLGRCVRLHFLGVARTATSQSEPDRRKFGLIHIDGPGPPKKPDQIAVVAASAASVLDFIARVRELGLCEGFDLEKEWNEYVDHRRKKDRPSTLENFAQTWVPRMQRRFGKIKPEVPKKTKIITPIISGVPAETDQLDLFEELTHRKFLAEKEARKLRKAAG